MKIKEVPVLYMRVRALFIVLWCWMFVMGVPVASATTQFLDVPANGQQYSGLGTVHGWICTPRGELTVRFNGGEVYPLPYGMRRKDVVAAGLCDGHERVGFAIAWNWGDLGDGEHTAIVYDDGVPIFERTFLVTTFETSFLRGVDGSCLVDHFPDPGDITRFTWNEGTQRLELDTIIHTADP